MLLFPLYTHTYILMQIARKLTRTNIKNLLNLEFRIKNIVYINYLHQTNFYFFLGSVIDQKCFKIQNA